MFVNELFGHEAGAYTGSVGVKKGLVELADGGTLFMDEIGEISADVQAKLLRILDAGSFRRLGGNEERHANFRLVCATNRDLKAMVAAGGFRADLFYRINSMQVDLPPLRRRLSDIPELARHFLSKLLPEHPGTMIAPEALALLQGYDYPGNMRELKHILERAVLMSRQAKVEARHLPPELARRTAETHAHDAHDAGFCDCAEGDSPEAIRHALQLTRGNRKRAAAFLKISERTLYRRLKQLDPS
jgi:transcriptional regulator with PAS, ATPase and Fis domain